MGLDSTTVVYIGKILQLNPSWSLVTLVIIGGILWMLVSLIKNTDLTKTILYKLGNHEQMAKTISDIRTDQLTSNEERKILNSRVGNIENRLGTLEKDVEELKCNNVGCPNRKV